MKALPLKIAGAAAAGAALLLADALFFESFFFQINRFSIGNRHSAKKIRIVFLSDLHFKKRLWPFHHRLANTINHLRPGLLLFSGDIIDQYGQPAPARQFFRLLQPGIPRLVIPGNHDHKNSVSRNTLRKIVEETSGRLLVNETVQQTINGVPITITGLDDFIEGESCVQDALRHTGREKNHLLLIHSPLQQEQALAVIRQMNEKRSASRQIALQYIFAGHTHGGQVRLGSFIPRLPKKSGRYVNGWYNRERPFLYVSKGFGTAALPFRFGARPEIAVFDYGVEDV